MNYEDWDVPGLPAENSDDEMDTWVKRGVKHMDRLKSCPVPECNRQVVTLKRHLLLKHQFDGTTVAKWMRKHKMSKPDNTKDKHKMKKCLHCGLGTKRMDKHLLRNKSCAKIRKQSSPKLIKKKKIGTTLLEVRFLTWSNTTHRLNNTQGHICYKIKHHNRATSQTT